MWRRKYGLPENTYGIAIRIIRNYPEDKATYEAMLYATPEHDGQPRGNGTSDPTLQTAIRRERLGVKVAAVDKAISKIPEEYKNGVLNNIIYRTPFPTYADINTWKHYKSMMVWTVAKEMGDI